MLPPKKRWNIVSRFDSRKSVLAIFDRVKCPWDNACHPDAWNAQRQQVMLVHAKNGEMSGFMRQTLTNQQEIVNAGNHLPKILRYTTMHIFRYMIYVCIHYRMQTRPIAKMVSNLLIDPTCRKHLMGRQTYKQGRACLQALHWVTSSNFRKLLPWSRERSHIPPQTGVGEIIDSKVPLGYVNFPEGIQFQCQPMKKVIFP